MRRFICLITAFAVAIQATGVTPAVSDRKVEMIDGTGTTEWEYTDGDLTKMISPQGTIEYDYDGNARLEYLTEVIPGGSDIVTTYVYDDAGRTSTIDKFGETTTFVYDDASRREKMIYDTGAYAKYSYDGRSRITAVEHFNSSDSLLRKETNVYDAASRITSRYEGPATGGVTTTFGYDDVGQLTSEFSTGYSASYTYDANGNRATRTVNGVTETYTVDNADKLTSVTWSNGIVNYSKEYAYHFSGRATGITYKTNGFTQSTETLGWNKENRLISRGTDTFTYNGLNTRVAKSDGGGSFTFKRTGGHQTAPVLSDGAANYLPGISEKRSGTSTFLHTGIKNQLLQTNTSQSNTATNRYDAFGNLLTSTGTWKGAFGYGGKFGYQTDDTDMELLGDRYYDPSIGRFLSRDIAKDGRNWYTYCGNDPLANMDPSGLIVDTLLDIGGFALSLADFIKEPSFENGAWLILDGAALLAPCVPGTKSVRILTDVMHGGEAGMRGARLMGNAGTCFVEGTQVLMGDGTSEPIENIEVGDTVQSRSEFGESDGPVQTSTVVKTFERQAHGTLTITVEGGAKIETTAEHPFYVVGVGFVEAGKLSVSDRLSDVDGDAVRIASIEHSKKVKTVYNFEVAETHTYFVQADDTSVWVHNKWHANIDLSQPVPGIYLGKDLEDGLPYVGSSMDLSTRIGPGHHALDLREAVDFFPMPGAKRRDILKAEQELMNALRKQGVTLGNKRNAIARKRWKEFGIGEESWF